MAQDDAPPPLTPQPKAPAPTVDFNSFLEQIDDGALASNATEELRVLVRELRNLSAIVGLKPKGKIRIEIGIEANGTIMDVTGDVKVTMPRRPRVRSPFYPTRDNGLSAVNPAQLGLEFRDVTKEPGTIHRIV